MRTAIILISLFFVVLLTVAIIESVPMPHSNLAGAAVLEPKSQQYMNLCMKECMRSCVTAEGTEPACIDTCTAQCTQ